MRGCTATRVMMWRATPVGTGRTLAEEEHGLSNHHLRKVAFDNEQLRLTFNGDNGFAFDSSWSAGESISTLSIIVTQLLIFIVS